MSSDFLDMDERNVNIALRVCTTLYLITLSALSAQMIYKQFVLRQAIESFEGMAIIVTFNAIALLGSLLYFGGFTPKKVSIRRLGIFYLGFVLLGWAFTMAKYFLFLRQELDVYQIINKLFIVAVISGILVLLWWVLAFFGNKRIEKQIS